jgi:hypothetical protein
MHHSSNNATRLMHWNCYFSDHAMRDMYHWCRSGSAVHRVSNFRRIYNRFSSCTSYLAKGFLLSCRITVDQYATDSPLKFT